MEDAVRGRGERASSCENCTTCCHGNERTGTALVVENLQMLDVRGKKKEGLLVAVLLPSIRAYDYNSHSAALPCVQC